MAKPRTPKDNQEKDFQDKMRKKLTGLFSGGEEPPTYMSISQVEALKAHVTELEAKLAQQGPVISQNVSMPSQEKRPEPLPIKPVVMEERQKRIGLWVAGIFAAFSSALLIFSFYMVYVVGPGHPDLSDRTLEPVASLMIIASLISFYLIRRDRLATAAWILLSIVIIPPIPAVLVLKDIFIVMILYIAILAPILIAWVLPKTARRQAINATGASILAIIALQVWNPAFRLGSSSLPDFTTYIIVLAALAILGFFVRQAMVGSIRTKLVLAFVAIAIASVGSISFIVDRSLRTNRTNEIGDSLAVLANAESLQVGQTVENEFNLLNGLALTEAVQDRAEIGTREDTLTQAEINQLDLEWQAADAANNNNDPLVAKVLNDNLSAELIKFQTKFPEHVEIFLTDLPGVSIATTDRTSGYLQSDEDWWQIAYKDGQYIGQPAYDASTKTLSINMAVPVRARGSNQIVGILRTTVNTKSLSNVLSTGRFGQTGRTEIYLPDNQVISLVPTGFGYAVVMGKTTAPNNNIFNQTLQKYQELSMGGNPSLVSAAGVSVPGDASQNNIINKLGWQVVVHQDQAEALAPVETQTLNDILLALIVTILAALVAVGLAQVLAGPIMRLNVVAEKVASGDLSVVAKVESDDETGTLALTFNNMISQLRGLIGTLELRVADRTHDLELAAEVGRAVSEKSVDIDGLLSKAVELIGDRFNLYYTQVYLTDSIGRNLILRAGTGAVGSELLSRAHQLPIASGSINGRAAAEKHSVIVADTKQSADFKPNPILPDTRSEMATPLIAGGQVVGVLDMQSDRPGTLSETNLPAFEALAGQLAIAIQNAALFSQAEQARSDVEAQVHRLTEQGWQDFLDAIEHGERMGFAFDQSSIVRLEGESITTAASEGYSVPISVTGTKIGAIQFGQEPNRIWTNSESELIEGTATQLAQHIENLRLLAQAEKYRAEAEQAVRRLTREGWDTYLQPGSQETAGFKYDLNEVSPLNVGENDNQTPVKHQALKVRDEVIGELSIQDSNNSQEDANELMSAVAAQLSSHIENLRLSLINMSLLKSTEERAQREQTLRQITVALRGSTNPATIMRTAVRELGSILGRKTIVQLSNPERPNQAESAISSENEPDSSANQS